LKTIGSAILFCSVNGGGGGSRTLDQKTNSVLQRISADLGYGLASAGMLKRRAVFSTRKVAARQPRREVIDKTE
jgi:hypothetical protein